MRTVRRGAEQQQPRRQSRHRVPMFRDRSMQLLCRAPLAPDVLPLVQRETSNWQAGVRARLLYRGTACAPRGAACVLLLLGTQYESGNARVRPGSTRIVVAVYISTLSTTTALVRLR